MPSMTFNELLMTPWSAHCTLADFFHGLSMDGFGESFSTNATHESDLLHCATSPGLRRSQQLLQRHLAGNLPFAKEWGLQSSAYYGHACQTKFRDGHVFYMILHLEQFHEGCPGSPPQELCRLAGKQLVSFLFQLDLLAACKGLPGT